LAPDGTVGLIKASVSAAPVASLVVERLARLMDGVEAFGGAAASAMPEWA